MIESMKRLFLFSGTLNRARYLVLGVSLFAVKFVLDWAVAQQLGRAWSPLNYLLWPDRDSVRVFELSGAERELGLILLALALPFVWIGTTLTLQRLRDAHLPLGLVLLFFLPLVNLLMILALCVVPSRPLNASPAPDVGWGRGARAMFREIVGESDLFSLLLASLLSAVMIVGLAYVSTQVFESYGFGVFVAAPFALGWMAVMIHGLRRPRSWGECLAVALSALAFAGVATLVIAFEGLLCLIMASPIALVLVLLGAKVGHVVQSRSWANESAPTLMLGLFIALPSLTTAESFLPREPTVRAVRTEILVEASAERVWRYVVAFPPLPEPSELWFRAGIAYPQRAEIHGRGVGAIRHCIFSTGAFVEPIDVWDEPRRLAFKVTAQPPTMKELSPFKIHPPHLDDFLVSHRGEFLLEELPDGRTRLSGTTWYSNRMWPTAYWNLWSDAILHEIHGRVLEHVRDLAEHEERAAKL